MATVQGLTKARTLEIEDGLIVSASFDSNAHLILTKNDDSTIDAGEIVAENLDFGNVSVNDLGDVSIGTRTNNNLLVWSGSQNQWVNKTANNADVATLTQVNTAQSTADAANLAAGDAYTYAAAAMSAANSKAPTASPTFTGLVTAPNIAATIIYDYLPSPPTKTSTVTLTSTELLGNIIISSGTATATLTLPPAGFMDSGITNIPDGYAFTWSVINTVAFAKTMAAGTSHTYVGNPTIAANASAQFVSRKNATASWTTYRIS